MGNDAALKTSLLWLAAIIVVVGLSTHSPRKMLVTYIVGVLAIAGVLLPDWDYFNRHFSRWPYPVTADERASLPHHGSAFLRFASSPLRVIAYSAIYGYAIYKWWDYVSDDS
ncbi:signal peptidase complex-like protein DTM1 [Neltuma alba]|uniref:signal peptidase complex-like protein DTM1 n=1 Tax=Neltuma alba TaxID=207710 RepID=UPI0010A53E69|nr:signal peptidase complex-like protein DTM1 [Prosopis alba]